METKEDASHGANDEKGRFPVPVLILWGVLAATLVNLLAAGGIFFPAIALTVWLLAAMILPPPIPFSEKNSGFLGKAVNVKKITEKEKKATPPKRKAEKKRDAVSQTDASVPSAISDSDTREAPIGTKSPKMAPPADRVALAILVPTVLMAWGVFYYSAWRPYRTEKKEMAALAQLAADSDLANPFEVGPARDSIPVAQSVYLRFLDRCAKSPTPENLTRWRFYRSHLFRIAPQSAPVRALAGSREWELAQSESVRLKPEIRGELFRAAAESFSAAVHFAPTDARYRASFGLVLIALGQKDRGKKEMDEALALDAATPHEDRKLDKRLRQAVEAAERNQ